MPMSTGTRNIPVMASEGIQLTDVTTDSIRLFVGAAVMAVLLAVVAAFAADDGHAERFEQ